MDYLIVILIVAAAGGYLGHWAWKLLYHGGCGGKGHGKRGKTTSLTIKGKSTGR